jgi:Flp pilus assembly protein TadD
MRIAMTLSIVCAGFIVGQVSATQGLATPGSTGRSSPSDFDGWIDRGHEAFRAARYEDAIAAYQHAVDLKPGDPKGHVHLGTVYMQLWIPGADSPENVALASRAEAEFRRVLAIRT